MKHFILLFLTVLFFTHSTHAVDFCLNPRLDQQAILADGRIVPLFSHAKLLQKFIFRTPKCENLSATAVYCHLSLGHRKDLEEKFGCKLDLKVEHLKTKAILGISKDSKAVSYEVAKAQQQNLMTTYHQITKDGDKSSSEAQDISNVLLRLEKFDSIISGQDWSVLDESRQWLPLNELVSKLGLENALTLSLSSRSRLLADEERTLGFEVIYDKFNPFLVAVFVAILGVLISILAVRNKKLDFLLHLVILIFFILELCGITLRVLISGRGPVTNMYETVMWVGFCIFILSSILGFKLKNKKIWAVGFTGVLICLFMMNFADGMLDATIQPLVPVLRDNFWLSTHVTSVTLSYGCFALSWFIANYVLIRSLFKKPSEATLQEWNYVIRIAMQVGVVFLAAGVILGGVWADYSWGRFWGWDPKETWSLIALVVYMGILHGRYVGWFKGIWFTIMAAIGFLFVLMAWFGVNYILAVGLHSYGFSSGGATFLTTIFLTQVIILITASIKIKTMKKKA